MDTIIFWIFTLGYALSFILLLIEIIFKKIFLKKVVDLCLYFCFFLQTIFIIVRWKITGHFPYVTSFESAIITSYFSILIYLILSYFNKDLKIIIIAVLPITFLLLGWANAMNKEKEGLSVALQTIWLTIHASFATLGAANFLIGTSCAIVYLKKKEKNFFLLMQKFTLLGFICWSIMIISGSIWANKAWGTYWGWDPIETWSLITWFIYVLYLHLNFAEKKFSKFAPYYLVVALFLIIFTLWGVSKLYKTIHLYG